jgi:hypothetical protein
MHRNVRYNRPFIDRRAVVIIVAALLLPGFVFSSLSCGNPGNATDVQRAELAQAVQQYWEAGRDYSLGFTSGVGDITYADVQGNEAEVHVEIIVGYTQPTDGAGYKETTFRLQNENGVWKVTYDGWTDKQIP